MKKLILFCIFVISIILIMNACQSNNPSDPGTPTSTFTSTSTSTVTPTITLTPTITSTYTITPTATPTNTAVIFLQGLIQESPYFRCYVNIDGTNSSAATVTVEDISISATPVPLIYNAGGYFNAYNGDGATYIYGHMYRMVVNADSRVFTAEGVAAGDYTFHANGDNVAFNYPGDPSQSKIWIYDATNGYTQILYDITGASPYTVNTAIYTAGIDYSITIRQGSNRQTAILWGRTPILIFL